MPRRSWGAAPAARRLALLTTTLVAFACGAGGDPATRPAPSAPPPNLLLISIDSLRADHLGVYGYHRDTSPNLDRLATEGAYFARTWSTSSWTLPAHASMLSSLGPATHGLIRGREKLNPAVDLLPEALAAAAYRSAGAVSVAYLGRRFGFDQGWEEYDDTSYAEHGVDRDLRSAETVARRARELLDRLGGERFFLFLHFFDVHYDYVPPPPFDGMFDPAARGGIEDQGVLRRLQPPDDMPPDLVPRLEALYDGEIRSLDGVLGELFAELERRGLSDDTLVMVTADHGDEFLEHGRLGHKRNLYDSTVRVPLIVRWPNGGLRRGRIDTPASLLDIAPTLAAAAGAPLPESWQGRNLLPVLRSDRQMPPLEVVADLVGRTRSLVDDGRYKLVTRKGRRGDSGSRHLYDLLADPRELRDLADMRADVVARLLARLDGALDRQRALSLRPGDATDDGDLRRELRALGYL